MCKRRGNLRLSLMAKVETARLQEMEDVVFCFVEGIIYSVIRVISDPICSALEFRFIVCVSCQL